MDKYQIVTLIIAIWGAITGSIALFVRVQSFLKDRAKLKIKPFFERSYSNNAFKPTIRLIIKISNSGKRPATLDRIVGEFEKKTFHPLKFKLSQKIDEGKSATVFIEKSRLPNDSNFYDLKRVLVFDQTDKKWKSKKKFGQNEIQDILNAEKIKSNTIGENSKYVKLDIYKVGTRYTLSTIAVNGPSSNRRKESFNHLGLAEKQFDEYTHKGQKFVDCEINQFEFST